MRRILLLVAVAAMMAAMMAEAGPAGAAAREPIGFNGPGQASEELSDLEQHPNNANPTPEAGQNCYGEGNSNTRKGPGIAPEGGAANPGSFAVPTEFPEGTPNYTGHAVSTLDTFPELGNVDGDPGDEISFIQESTRDADAGAANCDL